MAEDNKIIIPKLIQQLEPDDKNKWHPIWKPCRTSWLRHHPGQWRFTSWRDHTIDAYIFKYCPDWWDVWHNFPIEIVKLDIARYIIMFEQGGIYADMDTYCYRNFYDELEHDTIYLAPGANNRELVQNSLLISSGRSMFWREVIEECFLRLKDFPIEIHRNRSTHPDSDFQVFVRRSAGCGLLSEMYEDLNSHYKIKILDRSKYQVQPEHYDPGVVTRHMLTGRWGNETHDAVVATYRKKYPDMSVEEIFKRDYKEFRDIDIDNLDWNKQNG